MSQIPRIYHSEPLTAGTQVTLEEQAGRHILRVLRLRPGAELILFDGAGGEYEARLAEGGRAAVADVISFTDIDRESRLEIHLAQVIARGERMDQIIQKAVELGVQRITPLTSERCGVRLEPGKAVKRLLHWQGVIASACEQCGRNRLPEIDDCIDLSPWLADGAGGIRFILHPEASERLADLAAPEDRKVTLLVGPEGGLTDAEVDAALACGFHAIRLGPRVLRTETAGMAAVSTLQALWGDFC
ncbi:MAG: 16S rRNA (uracil(1498)-N(3))-methyltransferase [Gammaproteobacteria bacterium]|nr:16S rRNA (uracil(1498)-N(3))-methyltransferase [Gammaproteobacteria bacterium]